MEQEHGTYGYARRLNCKCAPCRQQVRRYDKRMRWERANGITRKVDAHPARAHLRALNILNDLSVDQISRATGGKVRPNQIQRLLYGHDGKAVLFLYKPTADRLLALTYEDCLVYDSKIWASGVHRRIEALGYMGHGMAAIAAEIDISYDALNNYMNRNRVLTRTVRKVDGLYREWSMIKGDNERARWRAYRKDHAPPMAWDEDTIDDPLAEPDRSAIVCVVKYCNRVAAKHSLCPAHIRKALERDGFRSSERFRTVVMQLGTHRSNQGVHLLATIHDFKEMGVSPAEAAARLHRTAEYIEAMYEEIA